MSELGPLISCRAVSGSDQAQTASFMSGSRASCLLDIYSCAAIGEARASATGSVPWPMEHSLVHKARMAEKLLGEEDSTTGSTW
jgi:hypothetical protein